MADGTPDWNAFVEELKSSFGQDAADTRHEIYFLNARKTFLPKGLLAFGAFLRDVAILFRQSARTTPPPPSKFLAVLSAPGRADAGYRVLKEPLSIAREFGEAAIITHPHAALRDGQTHRLKFPGVGAVFGALAKASPLLRKRSKNIGRMLVLFTVARKFFWIAAWKKTLEENENPILLLHNDFDMISSAGVAAIKDKGHAICIQHGVPTDEFFPTQADIQVVWGATSRKVYEVRGGTAEIIEDTFSAGPSARETTERPEAPQEIVLISQTHTPIYGIDLRTRLEWLTAEFAVLGTKIRILLHPRELTATRPYASLEGRHTVEDPPHALLGAAPPRFLVIGFSSTALIDAAKAGHYAAGLSWPAERSLGALGVARPPASVESAADAMELFRELRGDGVARTDFLHRQNSWLCETFHPTGAFRAEITKIITAPGLREDG